VGEATDVAGLTDDLRGDDGPHPIELGQRRARCLDADADPAVRLFGLGVESAYVVEELEGHVVADLLGRGLRRDLRHEPLGFRNVHSLAIRPGTN
jgi:hypothetical protein